MTELALPGSVEPSAHGPNLDEAFNPADAESADGRGYRRCIQFHSPPRSRGAIGIELNRLDYSGEADNATDIVHREQRYR
jgi:hypothetical protein